MVLKGAPREEEEGGRGGDGGGGEGDENKEKEKEEEGQEAPYNWLPPDHPPLAAFTSKQIVNGWQMDGK